jgi:Tol biopolymer transport system component
MPTRTYNLIIALSALIILFLGYTYLKSNSLFTQLPETVEVPRPNEASTPRSTKVYLSLVPPEDEGPLGHHMSVYTYDLDSKKLEPFFSASRNEYLQSKLSPDGSKIALSVLNLSGKDTVELVVGDPALNELTEIPSASEITLERAPSWSKDGTKIAFMGRAAKADEENVDVNDTSIWRVFMYDLSTRETIALGTGMHPVFTPDNTLLVLKSDGIYELNESGGNTRVLALGEGNVSGNIRIDISRDGTRFAASTPDDKKVRVWGIQGNGNTKTFTETHSFDVAAFWPIFSPKGDELVVQEFDWDSSRGVPEAVRPRLVRFNLSTKERTQLTDLSMFDQMSMFVSDWQ